MQNPCTMGPVSPARFLTSTSLSLKLPGPRQTFLVRARDAAARDPCAVLGVLATSQLRHPCAAIALHGAVAGGHCSVGPFAALGHDFAQGIEARAGMARPAAGRIEADWTFTTECSLCLWGLEGGIAPFSRSHHRYSELQCTFDHTPSVSREESALP